MTQVFASEKVNRHSQMERIMELNQMMNRFNEYYKGPEFPNQLCRTPNMNQMAQYSKWVEERDELTSTYSMIFSRSDCPGCIKSWSFTSLDAIEKYLTERIPTTTWDHNWYPNGLSIYKNAVNGKNKIMLQSSYDNEGYAHEKMKKIADIIIEMQKKIDVV